MNSLEEYYESERSDMASFIPADYQRVLEIGCGDGGFSKTLKPEAEVWGVEPFGTLKHSLYRVYNTTYEEAYNELPDSYFDLVICNDVIEHLPNHDDFFESIQKKMKPGAALIGSIPNVRYYKNLRHLLFDRDWKYTESGILDYTHLRFFTEKSLRDTIDRHSFTIDKFERINGVTGFKLFILFLNCITFNRSSDTRFLQFAFRIRTMK